MKKAPEALSNIFFIEFELDSTPQNVQEHLARADAPEPWSNSPVSGM